MDNNKEIALEFLKQYGASERTMRMLQDLNYNIKQLPSTHTPNFHNMKEEDWTMVLTQLVINIILSLREDGFFDGRE